MSAKTLTKRNTMLPGFFDDFFRPWNEWFESDGMRWGKVMTMPAVNIVEGENDFMVSLAAPGMKKDDFDIEVKGNMLTIRCEKEEQKDEKESTFTRKEYNYSSFCRSFTLPEKVNKGKIEARYEEGVLKLSLPKNDEAKKRIISKHVSVK